MPRVLLAADVDRSVLDTFDLWTRFETLPRAVRLDLLGDARAVRRVEVSELPDLAPAAITTVDGEGTGYRARVHLCPHSTDRCTVTLVLDQDAGTERRAAADLARFVEFVLHDALDEVLDRLLEPEQRLELRPDATC